MEKITKYLQTCIEDFEKTRERAFLEAVEIIEGKVPSHTEVREFGRREQRLDRPNEEMVWWRNKPLLHFKWNNKYKLKILKLYVIPSTTPPQTSDGET